MVNIFLSASVPLKERDSRYFESADVTAIRDAVRALAAVVIPQTRLIWGGHPSITPLIREVMLRAEFNLQEHVTIYQSYSHIKNFPKENEAFEHIVLTKDEGSKSESNRTLREQMLAGKNFAAGIFIGGMEGVEEEFELFRALYPKAELLPVASTGAAAEFLYWRLREEGTEPDRRLLTDLTYMALFRDLLKNFMTIG